MLPLPLITFSKWGDTCIFIPHQDQKLLQWILGGGGRSNIDTAIKISNRKKVAGVFVDIISKAFDCMPTSQHDNF